MLLEERKYVVKEKKRFLTIDDTKISSDSDRENSDGENSDEESPNEEIFDEENLKMLAF